MSAFEQLAAIINLIKIVKPGGEETIENIHSTTFIRSLRKCVGKTNERNLTSYFGFFKNGEEKKPAWKFEARIRLMSHCV